MNKMIKKITVDVNIEQEAAYQLYKKSGFQFINEYRSVLGDGKEHIICRFQMKMS